MENQIIKNLLKDANEGVSLNSLKKKYHLGYEKVKRILQENNISIQSSSRLTDKDFYDDIFDIINTEEKAYWLGFIYADGYISKVESSKNHKYLFEVQLAEKDKSHLEKLKNFFNSKKDLLCHNRKTKIKNYSSYRLSRQNKHLWESLYNKGVTPKKSLTLEFPTTEQVPKEFQLAFIRGYIDGDGCITINNAKDLVYLGLVGSSKFLDKIEEIFGKGSRYKAGKNFDLRYSINKAIPILEQLYFNATVFLERKRNKALMCIENYYKKVRKRRK